MRNANALRWQGQAGHYEVYYLTADRPAQPASGIWIRYTMLAPLEAVGAPATCSLWFVAMDPDGHSTIARKASFAIDRMRAASGPFELRIGDAPAHRRADERGVRGRRLGPVAGLLRSERTSTSIRLWRASASQRPCSCCRTPISRSTDR